MIFLTVGTQFPFDRLVKSVDGVISEDGFEGEIFAQIGESSYQPCNFEAVSFLEKHLLDECMRKASAIISHAGVGTITLALDYNKPILVMPRMKRFKEHVNDHQVCLARKFEKLGHILVAYEETELPAKIKQLETFVPHRRKAQPQAIVQRIAQFLNDLKIKG